MNIVDRRPNPKGKSLSNRQRFLGRARAEVKSAVQDALRKRKVADVGQGEKVAIPTRGITEPIFHHSRRTGRTEHVVPGNKEYLKGDEIPRPTGGEGRGGSQGSPDGSGEDAFEFTLSKEEFLDMFFEDLELPDLVKKSLRETFAVDLQRAGYTVTGSPANLSIRRTMRNSMARRISLRRPKQWELDAVREAIENARARGAEAEAERLTREFERLERRSKIIPYIDPLDVRYNRFERVPRPNTEAVMFCLMDVSGSMTEAMKDLAKRFFMLLHVFLIRRYRHVDIVFIRHTSTAEEVDEETFFYSRETGGTVVSTALEKMLEIARARYSTDRWNIYAAQASDGDNYGADSGRCVALLGGEVLPLCQYFAYVEVGDGMGGSLQVCPGTAIYGEPTARSRLHTRTSRCVGSATRRRYFRCSTNYLRKGASVPDTGFAEAVRLEAPTPLFTGPNWDFAALRQVYDAVERIALDELGLDVYPVQIEVITSEQMLDAYASVGLPLMYRHWSFGKRFAFHETLYRKGLQGLAYEIVINSNPCICYIMEENSMTMQTLVVAHAAFGHNHFFKNNYLFRQWTDANGILDYLSFARDYVAKCEERYGIEAVERLLDAAHALKDHGVNRYAHRTKPNLAEEKRRTEEWRAHSEATYNDLWRTVPGAERSKEDPDTAEARLQEIKRELGLPEENLLYLIEKRAPRLEDWQRELVRIVRLIAQYFYPQKQLQLMNEGCATFVHYEIMRRLHDKGLITEGSMLEFLHSHSSVVFQPDFDDPRFSGLNPYALGFAMMSDIHRICENPTEEDREWFPDIAGAGDGYGVLRNAWANYRDESFVLQFLSPAIIRRFRLFQVSDDSTKPALRVEAIHDDLGYRKIRSALSRQYDLSRREPDVQVVDVDLRGDRCLILAHYVHNGVLLDEKNSRAVLRHAATLWGYSVKLLEIDAATDKTLKTYEVAPPG